MKKVKLNLGALLIAVITVTSFNACKKESKEQSAEKQSAEKLNFNNVNSNFSSVLHVESPIINDVAISLANFHIELNNLEESKLCLLFSILNDNTLDVNLKFDSISLVSDFNNVS